MGCPLSKPVVPGEPAQPQLWFFLTESTQHTAFKQKHATFEQVEMVGFTRQKCLNFSGAYGKADDYTFWIHSESTMHAVELSCDESILRMHRAYCSKDDVVQIICRPATEASPWSAISPSHIRSLALRTKTCRQRGVTVPVIKTRFDCREAPTVVKYPYLVDINEVRRTVTFSKDGHDYRFGFEYLQLFIQSQLGEMERNAADDCKICSANLDNLEHFIIPLEADGREGKVYVTLNVWQAIKDL